MPRAPLELLDTASSELGAVGTTSGADCWTAPGDDWVDDVVAFCPLPPFEPPVGEFGLAALLVLLGEFGVAVLLVFVGVLVLGVCGVGVWVAGVLVGLAVGAWALGVLVGTGAGVVATWQ